jgi:hypothetical protein
MALLPFCPSTGKSARAIFAPRARPSAAARGKITRAEQLISPVASSRSRGPGLLAQKFRVTKTRNRVYLLTSRLDRRGVRVVTNAGRGSGGRFHFARRARRQGGRAKSCGPGPPTLGSSSRAASLRATEAKEQGTPRRPRISRKPPRRERRLSRLPCYGLACAKCTFFARKARGCGQHPVFPASS